MVCQYNASIVGGIFQTLELNSMKIDHYSLTEQSVESAECNRVLKCIVYSSIDRYSLIEQSLCSEIL